MNKIGTPELTGTNAPVLTPLKRAFLALEDAQARVAALEGAAREPIAVIGLGCRVPGGDNPAGFWRLMRDGVDAIGQVPADRWSADDFYDADPDAPGRIATRYGGFLRATDRFDPDFFGIAPREAQGIDPQQRLMLEVSWEALEHAGQAPDRLERTPTGVYMGVCSSDYTYLQLKSGDPTLLNAHFTSGIAHSVITGRLSYLLGLQGPSLTIDTACSSSLVAVHLACQALRNRECRMVLAGGVNLMLAPDLFIALSHSRMLAPDGRCKTFDARADGFARGEGCGVVVLKRLSDAKADGDRVLALVLGSAVNQDGPSSGLTAPNGPAQEAVIREALARSGVSPRQVGFVEAHGTGTQLGDPLEVQALGAVFGPERDPTNPLIIGSVKTNIGHLEAAAGVVGLIKVVLALQHRTIPQHLHFRTPSPHIPWSDLPIQVAARPMAWEPIGGSRIGAVSSFGFSGTNAHVVIQEAPKLVPAKEASPNRACLLAISARNEKALVELADSYAAALLDSSDDDLADVCHTANAHRAHFAHRAAVIANTMGELQTRLTALAQGNEANGLRIAQVNRRDPPRIAFLFTGQGSQYAGMAQGLYEASPVFRAALDKCAELARPHLDRGLLDALFADNEQRTLLDQTAYTQPALFSVEFAIAELWRSWGIAPNIVAGHSVGEYTAACVAGVLTLEDALRLIGRRGSLMQSLPSGGAMAAIFAPEEIVAKALSPRSAFVSIAAVNGPDQTVISGRAADVEEICRSFTAQGIRHQNLPVSHAFHSPLVDPILDRFEEEAGSIHFSVPRLRLISNLTGCVAEVSEITQPHYWRRHVRETVRFRDCLQTLAGLQPDILIEIGPNPSLLTFARSTLGETAATLIPSLRQGKPEWHQMLEGLAMAYLSGAAVDWRGVSGSGTRQIVDLPTYPFQRERCWFEAKPDKRPSAPRFRRTDDPLLGVRLRSAGAETIYESRVSADAPGFIRHHRVLDKVILPAAAYLDMLASAARELDRAEVISIEDITISEAMLFDEGERGSVVQTVCGPDLGGAVAAFVSSSTEAGGQSDRWIRHVSAKLCVNDLPTRGSAVLKDSRTQCHDSVAPTELYAAFKRRGVDFGSSFRVVRQLWRGESQACGEIMLASELADEVAEYQIHPILLDGCLQVMAGAFPQGDVDDVLYLPIGIGRFTLYRRPGAHCWSHAIVRSGPGDLREADVTIFGVEGALIAELRHVQLKRVTREALGKLARRWLDQCLWETCWEAVPARAVPELPHVSRDWLLFADRSDVASALADHLRKSGDRCTLVYPGVLTIDADVSSVDPTSAEHYRSLLAGLRSSGRSITGVVHAWSLDCGQWDKLSSPDLTTAENHGVVSATLLAQALVCENSAARLWLLTRGAQQADARDDLLSPAQAPVWGLSKTLAMEHPDLGCVCVDLAPRSSAAEVETLVAELAESGFEQQVALREAGRRLARLSHATRSDSVARAGGNDVSWRLEPALPGTLEDFRRISVPRHSPGSGEVEIEVEASGVNFRDVLNVLGMYPGDAGPLGGECAGRVTAVGFGVTHVQVGDDVLAVGSGSFASHVVVNSRLVQRRPIGVSAEEGSSFPIAFLTAEFCLSHLADMRAGDRILVHAAAGGVGMAAVRLAQRAGAEVFATAGSPMKRELLRSIGVEHVFDSRSTAFADEILGLTDGSGVDVVLNSLAGEQIDASFRALRRGGRFVEIGKRGIKDPKWVAALNRDVHYFIADWGETATKQPALIGDMLARLVDELGRGTLTPLPRHVFGLDETGRAFRFMAQARHFGKIVVRHGRKRKAALRRDGTYLITGGLSGLGLSAAQSLATQGAGRLVLVSRRGVSPEVGKILDAIKGGGTTVLAEALDISDEVALDRLLKRIRKEGPPLRGVIHSAGVLDDAGLIQQNSERFARVFAPKVRGGWLLDRLTRVDPLDFFVAFSSVASVFGSPGQANYAAANAFLDLLARERRLQGLPGLSINWGPWTEVGFAADRGLIDGLALRGLGALTPAAGLSALEQLLDEDYAQVAVQPIDWRRYSAQSSGRSQSFLMEVTGAAVDERPQAPMVRSPDADFREKLASAPAARKSSIIAAFVRERALRALGLDPTRSIDPRIPLGELGLDSLLSVELRNTLSSAIGLPLPATLLFDCPTIEAVTDHLLKSLLADVKFDSGTNVTTAQTGSEVLAGITELSDDEVERLLATER